MKILIVLMSITILFPPVQSLFAEPTILSCEFSKEATFDPKGKNDVKISIGKDKPWEIIFSELDTGSPKING